MGKAPVEAVNTSLEVLHCLATTAPCSITNLAERLGRPKTTVYYHLRTLEKRGYVIRRGEGYDLSLTPLMLGGQALNRRVPVNVVESNLTRLAREANEVAVFGVEEHGHVVILGVKRPPEFDTEVDPAIGARLPLHASALGKALLSGLHDQQREALLDGYSFEKLTEDTITDEDDFQNVLSSVREGHHAHDHGERDPGVRAVASPVAATEETPVGGIGVVGPASRLYSDRFTHELPHLVERFAERVEHMFRS